MINIIYNYVVRKNKNVQYEYERYVQEHLTEHYENKKKQWKILIKLIWHYRVRKEDKPLLYWDNLPNVDQTNIVKSIYNEAIMPGIDLFNELLFGQENGTKIFLCPYIGTGDVYLASMYMNAYARKNSIAHFIVVVIGESNYKVASLFDFQIIIKVTQQEADSLVRLVMFLGKDNTEIIIMHHHAPQMYCGILENMRNINELNFSDLFLYNVFQLDLYADRELPIFNRKSNDIEKIFKYKGLEEGRTVVLSPYVNTLPPLPEWFWLNLAERLKNLGYIVCTNCGKADEKEIDGTIQLNFSYDIAVPILEKCGFFIGIRSGFCDVVSSANCKKIILYQPYIFWGAGTNYDYFSLNRNGYCEDAIELEHKGIEFLDLINDIIWNIENEGKQILEAVHTRYRSIDYIVVQAGGKGIRLGHLTKNKPKALVPVGNLPMIFHLFKKFPDKKFVVIGDYKYEVLKRYFEAFAEVDYVVIDARGKDGTCGGIQQALTHIPENAPFMLIWSDLVLPDDFSLDEMKDTNYVGISGSFPCRWKYENSKFEEKQSAEYGVAGLFVFENRQLLSDVPESGEFVRWLSEKNDLIFKTIILNNTNEYGLLSEYNKLEKRKCRPFNQLEIQGNILIKRGITKQGKMLGMREAAWYKKVIDRHFTNLPQIYAYEPLIMENIAGKNIYECTTLEYSEKKIILSQVIDCLSQLHSIGKCAVSQESYEDAYIGKTLERLEKVRKLVPFAQEAYVIVNGRKCRNFFYHIDEVKRMLEQYMPYQFVFLHGDCTFSNIMIREDRTPVLLDPRGYFGKTEFYGDIAYDWAKLYYSIVGNYDQFNLKRFRLFIEKEEVILNIESSGWEEMEDYFFELIGKDISKTQIKLIHAIIWLSLTTYAWEDYDSICGAFYNGLYYLEEIL